MQRIALLFLLVCTLLSGIFSSPAFSADKPATVEEFCRQEVEGWNLDFRPDASLPPFETVREAGLGTSLLQGDDTLEVTIHCLNYPRFTQLPWLTQIMLKHFMIGGVGHAGQKIPTLQNLEGSDLNEGERAQVTRVKLLLQSGGCSPSSLNARYLSLSCSTWNEAAMSSGRFALWGLTFDLEKKRILSLRDIFVDWEKTAPLLQDMVKNSYEEWVEPEEMQYIQTAFEGDHPSFTLTPKGLDIFRPGYPPSMWQYEAVDVSKELLRGLVKPGIWE